jgi:hypothetical protein
MILDGIIRSAWEILGDLSPSVSKALMGQEEHPLFVVLPIILANVWIKVIVPAFSALFSDSPWVCLCVPGKFSEIVVHF